MDKKLKKTLISLASLGAVMTAHTGKAETFNYESASALGEIRDMALSKDNKMFALKTSGAKIGDMELPVWVGNSDNLNAAFSAPWMTNAVASCAFFRDQLYIAPKGATNCLYRVNVGENKIPDMNSVKAIPFGGKCPTQTMTEPYLYATTNHLYAVVDTPEGRAKVHKFTPQDKSLCWDCSTSYDTSETKAPFRKNQIKDIVSKTTDSDDYLYILTTNGNETAKLWISKQNENKNNTFSDQTPNEWKEYNEEWDFTPLFDNTTTIAIHGDKLLSANANDDDGKELGIMFDISHPFGILENSQVFLQSERATASAIGSDGTTYYAEAIDKSDEARLFVKGIPGPKFAADCSFIPGKDYPDTSSQRYGAPVHKLTTQKQGEILGIAKDRLYRIR